MQRKQWEQTRGSINVFSNQQEQKNKTYEMLSNSFLLSRFEPFLQLTLKRIVVIDTSLDMGQCGVFISQIVAISPSVP